MYVRKSVAAPQGISPGSAQPKRPNVTIIFADDILSYPERDSKGILLLGNFVMKPNAAMIQVYMTPKKQKPSYAGEGDVDELIVPQQFEASHPGNSLEIRELIQNTIGKDVIILSGDCQGNDFDMYGTPCSPLRLTPSGTFDDTKTGHDLMFKQPLGTGFLPALYQGALALGAPVAAPDATLDLLVASGFQYKLPADAAGAAIDTTSIDHEHGAVISLIGSGGADPSTLSSGAGTAATVILKAGEWAALDNASIDLMVYIDGATTYLIEQKRS